MVSVLCCVLLTPLQARASAYTLFANGYSDSYTPSVPTVDFFGAWKNAKSYQKADKAFTNNFFQLGVKYQTLSFALFYRYDYSLTMHPDVAEYRYTFHTDRDNLQDRDYTYNFKEQRTTSHGARVGYTYQYNSKLAITSHINLIYSSKFQDRSIQDGYINGKTRLGDANANYHFSKDSLYQFLVVDEPPDGFGASLDFDINYQVNNALKVDISVIDAFHFITWNESPFAIGSFQVDHFIYDGQNVLQQQPLSNLQTHEGNQKHSFTQHLPMRITLNAEHRLGDRFTLSVQYQHHEIMDSYSMKGGYLPFADSKIAVSYNLQREALGLHAKYRNFYCDVSVDNTDFTYANSLSVFLGFELSI